MKTDKNSITSFGRSRVEDGYLIEESIIQTRLKLEELGGTAKITHFGAYGRIKFELDGKLYQTDCNKQYATLDGGLKTIPYDKAYAGATCPKTNIVYDYSDVKFEGVQPFEFHTYYELDNGYWQEIK